MAKKGENKSIAQLLKEHWMFLAVTAAIYALGIVTIRYQPRFGDYSRLEDSFWLFALALQAFIILVIAGFVLIRRWKRLQKKNSTPLAWGISFLLFSVTFLGLILDSLGITRCRSSIPCFFVFRQFMIWFAAGILYGIANQFIRRKSLLKWLSGAVILLGYFMFFFGLVKAQNIEFTMYLFLFFLFIPICFLMSYLFYDRSKKKDVVSFKYISWGFLCVGLTYMGWAPWHGTNIYPVLFAIFNMSLAVILYGLVTLRIEKV